MAEKSNGPSSLKQHQPRLACTSMGRFDSRQKTESSSSLRVTQKKGPVVAQEGICPPGARRQKANSPGKSVKISFRFSMCTEARASMP